MTMTNVHRFTNLALGANIRVVEIDGQPWFVASDVCAALDMQNPTARVSHLDENERNTLRLTEGIGRGNPNRVCVSESGLYKLIMRSDKPNATPFQNWVTQDVLPAIRKDGGYIDGEEKVATGELSEDELVFKAMEVMQREIGRGTSEQDLTPQRLHMTELDMA
jgi:prophage antirepressor-like protein